MKFENYTILQHTCITLIYFRKFHNSNPPFAICQVKYKEQSYNGAIYGCEFPEGTFRTLFITSFLDISNLNEITGLNLVFEDITIGNHYLTPDWLKWLWTEIFLESGFRGELDRRGE